ncbi:MAG: hypothetical protein AAB528_04800, partial [Chloroflexota bacterium]
TVTHGQQGLLFPRKDADGLARSLSLLVENPDLAHRLGQQGHQIVQRYRWEVIASQVEEYYKDCLRSADGRSRKRAV